MLKLAACDRWIGWSAEQRFRRLHLIANNARFVILTPERVPNLVSRVLGLSPRRLSEANRHYDARAQEALGAIMVPRAALSPRA